MVETGHEASRQAQPSLVIWYRCCQVDTSTTRIAGSGQELRATVWHTGLRVLLRTTRSAHSGVHFTHTAMTNVASGSVWRKNCCTQMTTCQLPLCMMRQSCVLPLLRRQVRKDCGQSIVSRLSSAPAFDRPQVHRQHDPCSLEGLSKVTAEEVSTRCLPSRRLSTLYRPPC